MEILECADKSASASRTDSSRGELSKRRADKQDSEDHFSGPLNKPNDTKITFIISCFLECFVGRNLIMR